MSTKVKKKIATSLTLQWTNELFPVIFLTTYHLFHLFLTQELMAKVEVSAAQLSEVKGKDGM